MREIGGIFSFRISGKTFEIDRMKRREYIRREKGLTRRWMAGFSSSFEEEFRFRKGKDRGSMSSSLPS